MRSNRRPETSDRHPIGHDRQVRLVIVVGPEDGLDPLPLKLARPGSATKEVYADDFNTKINPLGVFPL